VYFAGDYALREKIVGNDKRHGAENNPGDYMGQNGAAAVEAQALRVVIPVAPRKIGQRGDSGGDADYVQGYILYTGVLL